MGTRVIEIGDPILRLPARRLTREEMRSTSVKQLIEQMRETMREQEGVGLAAPQVGQSLQIIIIEDTKERMDSLSDNEIEMLGQKPIPWEVWFNPEISVPKDARDIVNSCVWEIFQAATLGIQIPSIKIVPRRSSTSTCVPFKSLHRFEADCISL